MQNRRKTTIGASTAMLLLALWCLPAGQPSLAAEPGSGGRPELKMTDSSSDEVTLSDLRDVGLCLMQIKQQARNIYMEATRHPIPRTAKAKIERPDKIEQLDASSSKDFLPARPEWLTFYVGTLEPIIHLFKEDLKDTQTGAARLLVPQSTKTDFEKLFSQYAGGVSDMNRHITTIFDLIGEHDNNIQIARESVALYDVADHLETLRVKAFSLIKNADGKEGKVEVRLKKPSG